MTATILKDKVIREINLLPEEKLLEVYNFIHYFRIGAESEKSKIAESSLLSYAGSWNDLADDVFDDFLSDVTERREKAFSGRRDDEESFA
ncbi:MAG: hypothetical protein B6I38_06955 [Anaerolineaceae bacterium 4572_5.1]|nr:MAG: hypothetical protein B6I38_06955 [Anaerolineaceae bacterium 4572_5.1]